MPQTPDAAVDQADANDLISFLKAITDSLYRRGVRYPQWFLLLVAALGILSGCRSSRDSRRSLGGIGWRSTRRWASISSVGRRTPPFSTCSIRLTCRPLATCFRPG